MPTVNLNKKDVGKKRIFIIHGWGGYPENCWFPWLKKELEKLDFEVHVPAMPNSKEPKIDVWIPFLKKQVGNVDEETYFVGHSIGCQTIMRYLQTINKKIGGAIFVAGFFNLNNLEKEEEKEIAKPWLENSINLEKVKKVINKAVAIFSDNDLDIPLEDSKIFEKELGAKIIVEHNKGHFSGDTGITKLPVVLDSIKKMI